jgi:tellurite resistance protein
MFLAELNPEEKVAYLELASLFANIDGNKSIFENSILDEYKKELEIENYTLRGLSIEEIAKVFKNERSKNIVLSEILRLIYSDGVYHAQERESVSIIKKHFGFKANEYESFKDWVSKIKELENYPKNE